MPVPTILAVGATGNIGVAAILAARKCQYNVLAIVRNQASADKLFQHVGSREGITTVEADVTSENGVQSVVDRVRAGELPAFQHVHSSCELSSLLLQLIDGQLEDREGSCWLMRRVCRWCVDRYTAERDLCGGLQEDDEYQFRLELLYVSVTTR